MRRLPQLVPDNTTIPFMRFRRMALIGSAAVILLSVLLVVFKGLNYGIDFEGGVLLEVSVPADQAQLAPMRSTLSQLGLGDVQLQTFGAPNDILIRVQSQSEDPKAQAFVIDNGQERARQARGQGHRLSAGRVRRAQGQ